LYFTSNINASSYKTLLVLFSGLTFSDAILTNIGLKVGCTELNSFVVVAGLGSWALFRVSLMGYLVAVFVLGYWFCKKHVASKALIFLKAALAVTNIYIGIVVFLGVLAVLSNSITASF
jgi:hypothetical protein